MIDPVIKNNGHTPDISQERYGIVLNLVKKITKTAPRRLLDIGCSDGYFTSKLAEVSGAQESFGVDYSQDMVKIAAGYGIKASVVDIDREEKLPFESNYFDFIFCGSVIELIEDPDKLLEEINRLLTDQGTLVITFPNLSCWANRIAVPLGFLPYRSIVSRTYNVGKLFVPVAEHRYKYGSFNRLLTLGAFKQLADKHNLSVVGKAGSGGYFAAGVCRLIDSFLSKVAVLGFNLICVVKKKTRVSLRSL